uniref:Uncharacterized protein n=1 Tax=Spongospora subterranea TaxID=70186 RepID=A0A0H5QXU0_9EUKA|eukprot:CRZ06567.1 hypothetical protein [Spongospora subterranea]
MGPNSSSRSKSDERPQNEEVFTASGYLVDYDCCVTFSMLPTCPILPLDESAGVSLINYYLTSLSDCRSENCQLPISKCNRTKDRMTCRRFTSFDRALMPFMQNFELRTRSVFPFKAHMMQRSIAKTFFNQKVLFIDGALQFIFRQQFFQSLYLI